MSPETALLSEVWQLVKNHIHISERGEVAESLLGLFDEYVGLGDLDVHANEFDRIMKSAILAHYGDDDSEEDEWE